MTINKPTGGFPPIIKCSKTELKTINENKNREFKSVINAVSIRDIINKRFENMIKK
jgi:hypothetical protein